MQITKIDTRSRKDREDFIILPFKIYKDNAQWVPALRSEMTSVMDRSKHPFYKHSEADFFLARSEGQNLGRIAVLHQARYSQHHGMPTAFFYYFDSIDDLEVSRGLFEAAESWARKKGLKLILGPKGFTRSSGQGLLVEGFDLPPAVGIGYHLPYYVRLVEDAGFVKETDHFSGYISKTQAVPERVYKAAEKVRQRRHFTIQTFSNRAELRKWIPRVEKIHREAFFNNPGYYPSTPEEFEMIANQMIQVADPRLIKLIMVDNDVAGFMIAYANINKAIRRSRGRLWPLGWFYILREMKTAKSVDLNGLGLLPKYQGLGSNALLYAEAEKTLRAFGFDQAEIVQVDERNFKSRSDMETMGVQWRKRHRTYRKEIG